MSYDKVKKSIADSKHYWNNRERYLAAKKLRRQSLKPAVRTGEPTIEELRACIKEGKCWWCGKAGWRRLARHTNTHGLIAKDIREMAFLLKNKAVCIKEESETMSIRRKRLIKLGIAKIPDGHLGLGVEHEYSEAGLNSMRSNQKHMVESITEEQKGERSQTLSNRLSKPHPCPVCGIIVPHAKPICCSVTCFKVRRLYGIEAGWEEVKRHPTGARAAKTRLHLCLTNPKYKAKLSENHKKGSEKYAKPHSCIVCKKIIPKSRPRKYCSPECAHNPYNLPIDEIRNKYLSGISSPKLAKLYHCCDHTIRRHVQRNQDVQRG